MIDFDEEIRKFRPSRDVASVEDNILKNDMSDIQDVILELLKDTAREKKKK